MSASSKPNPSTTSPKQLRALCTTDTAGDLRPSTAKGQCADTHTYVDSDIASLCSEAAMQQIRANTPSPMSRRRFWTHSVCPRGPFHTQEDRECADNQVGGLEKVKPELQEIMLDLRFLSREPFTYFEVEGGIALEHASLLPGPFQIQLFTKPLKCYVGVVEAWFPIIFNQRYQASSSAVGWKPFSKMRSGAPNVTNDKGGTDLTSWQYFSNHVSHRAQPEYAVDNDITSWSYDTFGVLVPLKLSYQVVSRDASDSADDEGSDDELDIDNDEYISLPFFSSFSLTLHVFLYRRPASVFFCPRNQAAARYNRL
ncbi:hypothetical protein B0H14DRAFT_2591136 [Mycena olivaceomarginata]|nr:hypothetical protein B0H14DRAFT_2591136 [Mycena olivaceomarginata]